MRVGRIVSWGLSLGLAAALVGMVGLPKLVGPDPNPIFALIAGRSGIALFEPHVRYATGVGEVLAALLLIWPRTRQIGALLASAITLGAISFHLSPWLGIQLPNMSDLMALLEQGKSVAEIDALGLPTDGGALFMTALAFFAAALAILWLERRGARAASEPGK